jgi:hypothetical protein
LGGWQGGEITQTMYAHVNKSTTATTTKKYFSGTIILKNII